MQELFTLLYILTNIITAVVFYRLGEGKGLPKFQLPVKRREQPQSNFTDPDLEDIRNVDPKKIQEAFMKSINKKPVKPEKVAEDFAEELN